MARAEAFARPRARAVPEGADPPEADALAAPPAPLADAVEPEASGAEGLTDVAAPAVAALRRAGQVRGRTVEQTDHPERAGLVERLLPSDMRVGLLLLVLLVRLVLLPLRGHVERRVRRHDPVAHPQVDHRRPAGALVEELGQAPLGPALGEVAAILDGGHLERCGHRRAAGAGDGDAAGRLALRSAADDEQALVGEEGAQVAREDALHRGAQIDRGAEEGRPLRLLEQQQRRPRCLVAVADAHGQGAAGEPLEEGQIGAITHAQAEDAHRPREPGEAGGEIPERGLAHRRDRVADVHDRAPPLRVERARGVAEHPPEIGGTARRRRRQRGEDPAPHVRVHRDEPRSIGEQRPEPCVPRPGRHPIARPQVRQQRRGRRAGDRERGGIGGRRGVDDDGQIEPARGRREVARTQPHQHVVGLAPAPGAVATFGLAALGGRQGVHGPSVRRAVAGGSAPAVVEELEREVRPRHEVVLADRHRRPLPDPGHAHPDLVRCGPRQVEAHRELLDHGQRSLGALGGHRVHVEAALAVGAGAAQPLRIAHHHAPRLAGTDGVEPRPVHAGGVPLEQRRVLGRALVDVGLVLRGGGGLLLDVAPDDDAVTIDPEAMERRAGRGAEAVQPLDHLGAGVEEGLVHLGDGEVAIDGDDRRELLDRQREPGRPLIPGAARPHRAHAVGRRRRRAEGGAEAAGPVLPGESRRVRRAPEFHPERLARGRADRLRPAHLAREHVGHGGLLPGHLEAGPHLRELERARRRHQRGGAHRGGVDEHPPLGDLHRLGAQREPRRSPHQERRAPVAAQPAEAALAHGDRLPVDEPLARVRRALRLPGGRDGDAAADHPQLRPGLGPGQQLRGRSAAARGDGGEEGEEGEDEEGARGGVGHDGLRRERPREEAKVPRPGSGTSLSHEMPVLVSMRIDGARPLEPGHDRSRRRSGHPRARPRALATLRGARTSSLWAWISRIDALRSSSVTLRSSSDPRRSSSDTRPSSSDTRPSSSDTLPSGSESLRSSATCGLRAAWRCGRAAPRDPRAATR